MDDWSQDLSPEPAKGPPPKMTDLNDFDFWDADQLSLASLPDPATDLWPAQGDDQTFSSEPSLGARVQSTLECSVPRNVLSHHLRQKAPLATLLLNQSSTTRTRTAKSNPKIALASRDMKSDHPSEKLKAQLAEATVKIVDLMGKHKAEDEQAAKLLQKIAEANATIADLSEKSREKENELENLHRTIEMLSTSNARLTEERDALRSKVEVESSRSKGYEAAMKSFQDESMIAQQELQHCRTELDETKTTLTELQSDLAHSNARCQQLDTQLTERPSIDTRAIREMRKSNQELNSRMHTLEEENRKLRKQVEDGVIASNVKCMDCLSLTEECTILRQRLEKRPCQNASVQTNSVETNVVEVQTDAIGGFDPINLSERVSGAREVLERTSLLRRHQEEVARLVHDHEQLISDLEKTHTQRLQEMEEQVAEEVLTKVQQTRRSLASDHLKRLDEMQRRHRAELVKIRSERDQKLASLTDSLEEALEQVAVTTEQLEHECQTRRVLERRLEAVGVDFEREKEILLEHHRHELRTARMIAQDERATLLDEIQRGCDEIITDRRRVLEAPSSTTTNVTQFDFAVGPVRQEGPATKELSPVSQSTSSSAGQSQAGGVRDGISTMRNLPFTVQTGHSFSLSQSLAETEAMVLEVLGGR